MRNLDQDQAAEVAFDVVRDHLLDGVEYMAVWETVYDQRDDIADVEEDDVKAVYSNVQLLLNKLVELLDEL